MMSQLQYPARGEQPRFRDPLVKRRGAVDHTIDREAEGELGAFAAVTANQRAVGLLEHLARPGHHLRHRCLGGGRHTEREHRDRER